MTDDHLKKMIMVTMAASIISVVLLLAPFMGIRAPTTGATIGTRTEPPVCLWQISGSGNNINQLITDESHCARIFERYTEEGSCNDEAGVLMVKDVNKNDIRWAYETSCFKIVGGKRFTIMSGHVE